jgi:hypothetical protein
MTASARRGSLVIPELGPSLGRLVAPPPPPPGMPPSWITVEDIRIAMVTQLFELAGDARRWASEGDRELALATLNREAWEGAWKRAVDAVAVRGAGAVSDRLLAAAAEARLPARRVRTLILDPEEVKGFGGRLTGGSAALLEALTALDLAAQRVRTDHSPVGAVTEWQEALVAAARRLEAAWLVLEEALSREWREWAVEVEDLRRWRRPIVPLVVGGAVLFLLAGYLGLLLGGYLPVPGFLRGIVEAIWDRWS